MEEQKTFTLKKHKHQKKQRDCLKLAFNTFAKKMGCYSSGNASEASKNMKGKRKRLRVIADLQRCGDISRNPHFLLENARVDELALESYF
jgi:hypothetical protein